MASDHGSDDHMLRAPVGYRRMISWELSEVKERVKKKKKRKKSQVDDTQPSACHSSEEGEDSEEFYSAPESPLSSDDTSTSDAVLLSPTSSLTSSLEAARKKGAQSKKKKKRKAQNRKIARDEFFRPICNLFEDEDSVLAVSDLSLTDLGGVLSLTELCLIKIQQVVKSHSFEDTTIPYLFQMMITQDKLLKSMAAVQMRWAERNFSTLELYYDLLLDCSSFSNPRVYETSLHCLTPHPLYYNSISCNVTGSMAVMRTMVHLCDFLFPLFGATSRGLDKVTLQIPAVCRVDNFLKTRYPKVTKSHSECLKLWPAYVCWARGHMKQASDFFVEAIATLKYKCDKAICWNELGRMMVWCGDRPHAVTFFRKSLEVVFDMLDDRELMKEVHLKNVHHKLVQVSTFAMMASAWDVGLMDEESSRGAAKSWQAVLKEYDTVSGGDVSTWYFHQAAMESLLCFHSVCCVVRSEPVKSQRRGNTLLQWMRDCEEFGLEYAPNYPVIYYHLSLVYALMNMPLKSQRNFVNYINYFADFQEWPEGRIPGNPQGLTIIVNQLPSPWQPMMDLMGEDLRSAPVLSFSWRTRLLHPLYPYLDSQEVHYLADHCSDQINLHFTEDGYLTGDMSMDFPPMRCVLLDPLTGKVCFSPSSSLAHYNRQFCHPVDEPAGYAPPQPLRLLDTEWCSVELVVGQTHDHSLYAQRQAPMSSCYHTILHWYGTDGSHAKLDLRRLIRKAAKDRLMKFLQTRDGACEFEIKRLETILDKGLIINWETINSNRKFDKVISNTQYRHKHDKDPQEIKQRNSHSIDFYLHMTRHCVIGNYTLLLTFQLNRKSHQTAGDDDVLVLINCSNLDKFLNPVVHYSVDGFNISLPEFEMASCYHNNHLPHIRNLYSCCYSAQRPPWKYRYTGTVDKTRQVRHGWYNECGKLVYLKKEIMNTSGEKIKRCWHATAGDRVYKGLLQDDGDTSIVQSWTLSTMDKLSEESIIMLGTQPRLFSLPGCLLVHTTSGVYLLDPISLTPMSCELPSSSNSSGSRVDPSGIIRPQFDIADCSVTILKVFDINWVSKKVTSVTEQPQDYPDTLSGEVTNTPAGQDTVKDDQSDVSNCCVVAMAINNRLIIMKITPGLMVTVSMDVELPGLVTEFHHIGDIGYLVASSVFHDRQREDVYWLSREGKLLGVIPCLGAGPRSFCSKFVDVPSENGEDHSGVYAFFNDGYGGIGSVRLSPP
ncbi:uncharacterized protein [Dysidea avara]|uniref:uncharacterized protein isoform X2 n=1 Tax=Dysidea avara TaxID=196820 RepID=UPI003323BF0E